MVPVMVAADIVSVLVVDDQAPFRLAARAVLRRTEGFELVGEAADGEEALARARELRPALVLMDINMPGMSGIEATRRSARRSAGAPRCSCARPTSAATCRPRRRTPASRRT